MVLLAHISDPHLGPLPRVRLRELASKRAFGYLNWRSNRSRSFEERTLAALLADLAAAHPDHIAVTGDLVNIGLPAEYDTALEWLHALGDPRDVTVIPGNHDAYVARAIAHYSTKWLPFASGDRPAPEMAFPFIRKRGPLALIGMSTAVPSLPLMATGRVKADQAELLGAVLAETRDFCRVVLIHHPPAINSMTWGRRLMGASLVRRAIAENGAELVLHGHNHVTSVRSIAGKDGDVPVVGAAALSMAPHGHNKGGAYNLFRIEGTERPYRIALTARGFSDDGQTVATVLETDFAQPTANHA